MSFKPAVRTKLKARIALCGPPKSGKSMTALRWAMRMALANDGRGRVAVIDTEHRSASKYIGDAPDGVPFAFDVCELEDFSPTAYMNEIMRAGREGYDVLIVDSLSHAWTGEGGILAIVDKATAGSRSKNAYTDGWREATPMHNRLIDSIIRSPCHIICTMRSKMEYVLEENERGQKVPRKIGLGPIQRQGMEYEFDVVGELDWSHTLRIGESRCAAVDGMIAIKPGTDQVDPIMQWLAEGIDAPEGYYAVTEADLAASEAARREAEKAKPKVAKPRKTKDELLKQGAKQELAVANGQSAVESGAAPVASASTEATAAPVTSAITPAADPTGAHAPLPAGNRLDWTKERAATETAKYREPAQVEATPSPTTDKPASAVAPTAETDNGQPAPTIDVPHDPVASGHEESLNVPCDESQQDHIYSLLQRIGDKGNPDDYRAFLQRFKGGVLVAQLKVQKLAQLTKAQAVGLIENLRALEAGQHLSNRIDEKNGQSAGKEVASAGAASAAKN